MCLCVYGHAYIHTYSNIHGSGCEQVMEAELQSRHAVVDANERRVAVLKGDAETAANRILADARAEKERLEGQSRELREAAHQQELSLVRRHIQTAPLDVRQ